MTVSGIVASEAPRGGLRNHARRTPALGQKPFRRPCAGSRRPASMIPKTAAYESWNETVPASSGAKSISSIPAEQTVDVAPGNREENLASPHSVATAAARTAGGGNPAINATSHAQPTVETEAVFAALSLTGNRDAGRPIRMKTRSPTAPETVTT